MSKNYVDYLAFDFDAVISEYERPWKFDKFGNPVYEIINTIKHYYDKGYFINIFTGRMRTPALIKWLNEHQVPYSGINVNPDVHLFESSFKPYYSVIVDDKAVNFHYKYNRKSKEQLIKEIDEILRIGKIGKEE